MKTVATLIIGLTVTLLALLALGAAVSEIKHPMGHAPHYSGDASIRHWRGGQR